MKVGDVKDCFVAGTDLFKFPEQCLLREMLPVAEKLLRPQRPLRETLLKNLDAVFITGCTRSGVINCWYIP